MLVPRKNDRVFVAAFSRGDDLEGWQTLKAITLAIRHSISHFEGHDVCCHGSCQNDTVYTHIVHPGNNILVLPLQGGFLIQFPYEHYLILSSRDC